MIHKTSNTSVKGKNSNNLFLSPQHGRNSVNNSNNANKFSNSSVSLGYQKNQFFSKYKLLQFQNHNLFKYCSIIVSTISVFGYDIKNLVLSRDYDLYPTIIFIFVFLFMIIEIIVKCYLDEQNYIFGFFFWIDLFGVIAIIPNFHWVSDYISKQMINSIKTKWQTVRNLDRYFLIFARINNVVRLFILRKNKEENNGEATQVTSAFELLLKKRILCIAIFVILGKNILEPNLFLPNHFSDNNYLISLKSFNYLIEDENELNQTFNIYVDYYESSSTPLLYAKIYFLEYSHNEKKITHLRPLEYLDYRIPCTNLGSLFNKSNDIDEIRNEQNQCIAIFDNSVNMKYYYFSCVFQSLGIFIILILSMIFFRKGLHSIAIDPIKQMADKIKNLSLNPAEALQENLIINLNEKQFPIEISLLINTVTKICGLLTLGYGEAGAGIISSVMKESSGGDVNPQMGGKTIMAIYGFCDIRNFTDTTEVLQEKVMIFVNEVAEIIHSITSDCMGSANKNIGDAFLLVWKFEKRHTIKNRKGELVLLNTREVNQIVDLSLVAFIKILIQVNKSAKLGKYKKNKLLSNRIPNYRVKMGFGLHLGYSIEGAIGSMYKIDASYLSPNVEKSAEVQEKSKDYGKELILSQEFVNYLSSEARKNIRLLGKHKDESVYTVDLDLSSVEKEPYTIQKDEVEDLNIKMETIKRRREICKKKFEDCVKYKKNIWNEYAMKDPDIMAARAKYTDKNTIFQKDETFRSSRYHND